MNPKKIIFNEKISVLYIYTNLPILNFLLILKKYFIGTICFFPFFIISNFILLLRLSYYANTYNENLLINYYTLFVIKEIIFKYLLFIIYFYSHTRKE